MEFRPLLLLDVLLWESNPFRALAIVLVTRV
jgi:hypothetical protein